MMFEKNIKNVLKETIKKNKKIYQKYFPYIIIDKNLETVLKSKINYIIKPFIVKKTKNEQDKRNKNNNFIDLSSIMDVSFTEKIETTLHYSEFNCLSNISLKKNKKMDKVNLDNKSDFDIKSMGKITLKQNENLRKESRRKIVEKVINDGEIFDIYNPVYSSFEENPLNNLQNIKKEVHVLKSSNLNSKKKKKKTKDFKKENKKKIRNKEKIRKY